MANPIAAKSLMADENDHGLITNQQATIADAVASHSLTDADASLGATTQAEVEAVLDALGGKINAILLVLEAHGLVADA